MAAILILLVVALVLWPIVGGVVAAIGYLFGLLFRVYGFEHDDLKTMMIVGSKLGYLTVIIVVTLLTIGILMRALSFLGLLDVHEEEVKEA